MVMDALSSVTGGTMNKVGVWMLVLVLCLCFISISNCNESETEEKNKKASLLEWQRLRDAYTIYSALFHPSIAQYGSMVKALCNHAYAHFFPPNIDFRRGDEGEAVRERENGGGEKVREALARSLEWSKVTIEDAAITAANIAEEAIHKVKTTFSQSQSQPLSESNQNKPQNEL